MPIQLEALKTQNESLSSYFCAKTDQPMSLSLKQIQLPIADELQIFEQKFRDAMRTKVALLDKIMHYIVQRKGKQMRPMFVFFAAKMGGEITEKAYRGAALIELLHTATLIHDDVVDDAYERRGFFSINALWKNKIAVLVGDYLLAKGLLLSTDYKDFRLLQLVAKATRDMSEGELLQIERSRRLNLDEAVYFEIIRQKTASLISSACTVGYASTADNEEMEELVWKFGEKVGIAFQIKDDLFDFGVENENLGKPIGIDIQEKKLTLPLIYAINHANKADRRYLINTVKRHHDKPKKVKEVMDYVLKSGGIEYAQAAMHRYKQEAMDLLKQFPDNVGRKGLEQLIWYTIERKR